MADLELDEYEKKKEFQAAHLLRRIMESKGKK